MDRQEALKIVRENYPHFGTTEPWLELEKALATLIPELRESEDERIRKALIEFLREAYSRGNAPEECAKWLVWLDRPKEQTPAEWSEDDKKMIERIVETIQDYALETGQIDSETGGTKEPLISYIAFLWSLRPSWKPSKEQLDALKELIDDANRAGWVTPGATELYEQLKKLM